MNGEKRVEVDFVRRSPISKQNNTMTMKIDMEDYQRWRDGYGHIQNILGYLTPDEREFLMTGITPAEWNNMFGGPKKGE